MNPQDRYIPGVPCWVDSTQPDPEAAVAFYSELFGWEFENVMPPGAPEPYFIGRLPGGDAAAIAAGPAAAWNTYVWVEDAEATAARVHAAGGTVVAPPADAGDAGRMAIFADPAGAVFRVWQAGSHRGAGVVNEPGSLNFNDLNTRDVGEAAAFYGAVFGWEVLPAGEFSAWALPGYGDFLEARNPGMREGMAAMGAPERFEDVVASLITIPDDQPDTQPHWGLTFAVDDADEIARRADKLGGWVVVAPFDAPWVRMTVITDPQGATFTASKFVPENKDVKQNAGAATGA
jgi:predicted enzyme related to lactoylglutathione lyase